MELFILILNKEEYLKDIVTLFVELGLKATVVDSYGMAKIIVNEIPIFTGFRDMLSGNRPSNKTILSIIKPEKWDAIIKGIDQICGPFHANGNGIFFTVPVTRSSLNLEEY